ncbi:MAG: SpoIIE family protein phosphatase [Clostridia bacterium]|nr:SpoIIE family protein phosphatase [Clostridia bacterium]
MKNPLRYYDYTVVIKYLFVFALFIVFNNLESEIQPYSTAVLIACAYSGGNFLPFPPIFICAFLISGSNGLLAQAAISAGFLLTLVLLYKRFDAKKNFGFIILSFLSLLGYIFVGDTSAQSITEKRILVSSITSGLAFFCCVANKAFTEKGLKFKFSYEEYLSVAAVAIAFGIGTCNYLSPVIWKGFTVFMILCCCYLFKFGTGTTVSAALGVSLAVYYHDVNYVAITLTLGLAAEITGNFSRYLSAAAITAMDFFIYTLFGVYPAYSAEEYLPVIIGALAFAAIPHKPFKELKEKLYSFRERQLVRQTINRNRLMLSNRLYELAGVFTEMSATFNAFKKTAITEDKAKSAIEREIYSSVCKNCKFYAKCKPKEKDVKSGLKIMLDVGFAKGKLSLIDLPKELSETCIHPNDILFGLNKMLAEYRSYALNVNNLASGRELIAEEVSGVSEILKGLALESGALLKYQSRLERSLADNLAKNGLFASEILIYGENERLTVSMIMTMKEFSLLALNRVITETLGVNMTLAEKSNITEDKIYLLFKRATEYDAVFGVASAKKDGSKVSGDTHSVIRINDEKFLVALSDGMGSGKDAETVSSVSLSLIESFYKAGMNSDLILNTVNKLLSVNTEDNFTALDVAVIDLKNLSSDFVKYGSPYGFIISDGRVRIVEANSLPLGILSDLKPSVCRADVNDGDMILLMTDGVSDAFGSSGDIIDYVRLAPARNPQNFADDVLNKAIALNGGEKKDDMTVLCVRIFKKPPITPITA